MLKVDEQLGKARDLFVGVEAFQPQGILNAHDGVELLELVGSSEDEEKDAEGLQSVGTVFGGMFEDAEECLADIVFFWTDWLSG